MRFVILTDIHLGPEIHFRGVLRKVNKNAKIFLDEFIRQMNNNIKPEFVVVLGDLIEHNDKVKDKENIAYIVKLLKKLECPVFYVAGNHDLKNISENKLAKLFNLNSLYYSFDSGSSHFIVLFSKVAEKGNILINDEQELWLKNDLKKTSKKCMVFVHHGLADQSLKGNPYFEGRPEFCLIKNRKEIRNILEQSNKVLAVFNSHLHWDKQNTHNSIPYFTIQSLTENEGDNGIASEAYAVVNIAGNKVNVEVKGNYSKSFSHAS